MRYGTFKFGSGAHYGEAVHDTQLWSLMVDWNGDGNYDVDNEARHLTKVIITRGRSHQVNSDGNGFQAVATGRLTIELDNTDGRYTPLNQASPLYPYVRTGVRIQLCTRLPDTGDVKPVFTGRIDNILPISGGYDRVKITALDGLEWLSGDTPNLRIQNQKKVEELIAVILEAMAWPWETNLGASTDVVPWFWGLPGTNAMDLINDLVNGFMGSFFVGADGSAVFYSRSHRLASAKMRLEQDQLGKEILFQSPWEVAKNKINMTCYPLINQAMQVVWSSNEKAMIADGESIDFWGGYSYDGDDVPISGYTVPVAGTDYQINTATDGGGTDLTEFCSVAVDVYGNTVHYTVTNYSGLDGYLILCQFRGTPLSSTSVVKSVVDLESQALYGPRSLAIGSKFLQEANTGLDIANAILLQQAYPQYYPTVEVINRPEIQYDLDLFDFVDLVVEKMGISGTYQLASIEHQWTSETGQASTSFFVFEPVNNTLSTVWTFSAQLGVDSIFAF